MLWIVLSVRDSASETFSPPFCVRDVRIGIRAFRNEVNDKSGKMFHSPSDYELFDLGCFDDVSGLFDARSPHRVIGGLEVVKSSTEL